jgi:hypothetical protein
MKVPAPAPLILENLDVTHPEQAADTWEKVVRKLRAGAMPPAGRPRPTEATYAAFLGGLEQGLDRGARERPNPGRIDPLHRLNRTEYQNAIRDLVAVDVDVANLLPADDGSYGFDNIAGVLRVSSTLLERYMAAAQKISRLAVGARNPTPSAETYSLASDLPQYERLNGLPFGTRGGTLVRHNFPADGEYVIAVRIGRNTTNQLGRFPQAHELEVSLDGTQLQVFTTPGSEEREGRRRQVDDEIDDEWDANYQVRVTVPAGPHNVAATFFKKYSALRETVLEPFIRPYTGITTGDNRYQPHVGSVVITGPFNPNGSSQTPSRQKIFACRPSERLAEDACAATILTALSRRAYRRPVTDSDLAPLLMFYRSGYAKGGFERGIEEALQRLLMAPEFLFRVYVEPRGLAPDSPYRISDLELASRLSFFLWSSLPDDTLIDLASQKKLRDPMVIGNQVKRMIADKRADALINNFSDQWLYLRNLPTVVPDETQFPNFDEGLRQAFRTETQLFFGSVVRENRNALDLLQANYSFLNDRLARHYGISGVAGSDFRRVTFTDETRGGLLGQGSILTATSYPTRTSPVVRGKWILENLLGTPPPPPPPNVPDLRATSSDGKVLSMRERMVQHRASPLCASCHSVMDPLGLALENFNAVGELRTRGESGEPIDASGALPDGAKFQGVAGLRAALTAQPERFVTTLTEKLLIYALGRGLDYYDAPTVRGIVRNAAPKGYRLSDLIVSIVNSVPFQQRRTAPVTEDMPAKVVAP